MKLNIKEFDRIVQQAIGRIPEEIRRHLDNILITVQKRPAPEMLEEMGYPPDEPLLGIYWGVPLNERSVAEPPLYPDTIFIFKEPLEEMCETARSWRRRSKSPWSTRWPTFSDERGAPGGAGLRLIPACFHRAIGGRPWLTRERNAIEISYRPDVLFCSRSQPIHAELTMMDPQPVSATPSEKINWRLVGRGILLLLLLGLCGFGLAATPFWKQHTMDYWLWMVPASACCPSCSASCRRATAIKCCAGRCSSTRRCNGSEPARRFTWCFG